MIDIESQVYTPIATALRSEFPDISVSSEYVRSPEQFPHVTLIESDNYITLEHLDSSDAEKLVTMMYEVNVYSNKAVGKKSECRAIMRLIDSMMYSMNFTRLSLAPIPNMDDATIYRMTARYRAETDGEILHRR